MPPALLALLGLAAVFLAALTVLPGLLLKAVAGVRRLRGRRAESPPVLGPLFWDELVRVTRRGAQFRLRTAYALFLLVSLLVAYLNEFREANPVALILGGAGEVPRERMTAFAETFFHVFLFCQLVALTAVTPVFAGGAVTEEKDRGTLVFLQTTLLSNREIVLGKLAARVAFVLGLSLTGLPVLALTLLFGGVDPDVLATSFVAAVMSTASLAAFCFWQATRQETLKQVLVTAYAAVVVLGFFGACLTGCWHPTGASLSPFVFTAVSISPPSAGFDLYAAAAVFVVAHGAAALLFAVLGMGNVRAILVEQPGPAAPPSRYVPTAPRYVPAAAAAAPRPDPVRRERPPLRHVHIPYMQDDDPLLWKETYFGNRLPSFEMDMMKGCATGLLVAGSLPLVFGVLVALVSSNHPQEVLNGLFRVVSIAFGAFLIPLAGVRAVGCVSRERQQQTLDSLFTLPLDRAEFLRAKWRAAYLWLRPWLIGFGVFSLIPLGTGSVHPVGYLFSLALLAAAVPFFLTLAVWLSVRCRTVVRATTWYLGVAFAAFLLPPMAAVLVRGAVDLALNSFHVTITGPAAGSVQSVLPYSTTAMSLPFALDDLAFPGSFKDRWSWNWGRRAGWYFDGVVALLPIVVLFAALLAAAALLWRGTVSRFDREGR